MTDITLRGEGEEVMTREFLGTWWIVEMEVWDRDYLNLVVPAHITFEPGGLGEFQFGTVQGWIDCRFAERRVEFSWEGLSDGDNASGRGWGAISEAGTLEGRLFIHNSDDSAFVAQRAQ